MKKLLILLMVFSLSLGCVQTYTGPQRTDIERVLKIAHEIYVNIRIVVTDPAVLPMFTPDEIAVLEELEVKYLATIALLKTYPDNPSALEQISWIATDILGILTEVTFVTKVQPYVVAIRISINVLRNYL